MKTKIIQFQFGPRISGGISQSNLAISAQALLLGQYFTGLSTDGQRARNQSVVVVFRGRCDSPFRLVQQTLHPGAWRHKCHLLMNGSL